jgi:molecular chaperone GrpE
MADEIHEECVSELEEGVSQPEKEGASEDIAVEPEVLEECAAEEVAVENALLEEIARLEVQLAEAGKKAAEYLDGLQRSQAAFANYRKRTEAEQVSWRSVANAALLARFLPVLDDFERAFRALPADFEGQSWLDGITLIRRKVAGILEAENVQPIVLQPGDAFDPLYHQAVFYQEVAGFEEGQIVAEVERGYILGERVLRPSSVVVAKAPFVPPAPEPEVGVKAVASPEPAGEVQGKAEEESCCCAEEESCECENAV